MERVMRRPASFILLLVAAPLAAALAAPHPAERPGDGWTHAATTGDAGTLVGSGEHQEDPTLLTRENATTPPAEKPPLARPTHNVGDRWEYRATVRNGNQTLTLRAVVSPNGIDTRADGSGAPHEVVPVTRTDGLYRTEDASGEPVATYRYETWERPGDGAVVQERASRPSLVPGESPRAIRRVYDTPCRYTQWPLAPGSSWSVDCVATETDEATQATAPFHVVGTGQVEAVRRAQVEAGSFDAYPVTLRLRVDDGPELTVTRLYAKEVCGVLALEPGPHGERDELTGWRCGSLDTGALESRAEASGPDVALVGGALAGVALLARRRKRIS